MAQRWLYKSCYLTVLLLYISSVIALNSGEPYTVTEIANCTGEIILKVRGKQTIEENEVAFVDCTLDEEYWKCSCKNPTPIILQNKEETKNEYDVTLEYYLQPKTGDDTIDDNYKRTNTFSDLNFDYKAKLPKGQRDVSNTVILGIVVIVIIFFILLIVFIGIYVVKSALKDDKDVIRSGKKDDESYKNADEIIRKYTK